MKWLWRLLGGPANPPVPAQNKGKSPIKAENIGESYVSNVGETHIKPSTVTLPPTAQRPDLTALAEKYSKEPKKRRHDKHRRGRQLPNGARR